LYCGGSGVGVESDGDNESSGSIGSQEVKTGKVKEAVLFSLSLLYSNNNISVCNSRFSSCPAYMFY